MYRRDFLRLAALAGLSAVVGDEWDRILWPGARSTIGWTPALGDRLNRLTIYDHAGRALQVVDFPYGHETRIIARVTGYARFRYGDIPKHLRDMGHELTGPREENDAMRLMRRDGGLAMPAGQTLILNADLTLSGKPITRRIATGGIL